MQMIPGTQNPARQPDPGDEQRDEVVGQAFAHRMGRAPDAVKAPALAVAEPGGERDDARGRAEALEPAVQRPQRDRYPEDRRETHADVDQRGGDHAGREEDLDVRVVGEEAVDELAERVRVEECGADEPEVLRREDALVDQRLLDDREREPAGVGKRVADGDRNDDAESVAPVQCVDARAVGDRGRGRARSRRRRSGTSRRGSGSPGRSG